MRATTLALCVLALGTTGAAASADDPLVSVREEGGTYLVAARFVVGEPAEAVRAVLTDYASIPRFMPGVRTSVVLERRDGYARVEQEAISSYLFFSKRVRLVLDIDETPAALRFRDRSLASFSHYEGTWTLIERGGDTELGYDLTARPAFSVPGFVLRRLLSRDARAMIAALRAEVAARRAAMLPTASSDQTSRSDTAPDRG